MEHGNKGERLATDTDVSDTIVCIQLCFAYAYAYLLSDVRPLRDVEHPVSSCKHQLCYGVG